MGNHKTSVRILVIFVIRKDTGLQNPIVPRDRIKDRKTTKNTAMSKEAARRISGEEDWETRPEPEPEQGEDEGADADGDADARIREEKEAKEMEEGYRDFEGEDEQEYQSFVQSLEI